MASLAHFDWRRDTNNPVLRPDPGSRYECTCCMNPFVVRLSGQYYVYYAGGDADGHKRICLATVPVGRPYDLSRQGVILDIGPAGSFDANWCVLPTVYQFGDKWHLYWSGRDESEGTGLQGFPGIGLAVGDDLTHFERVSDEPVITGDQTPEFPKNRGIAGGGTILRCNLPDGSPSYRMYYTLAVGRPHPDPRVDQEKHVAVCHSSDGVHWTDHRAIMAPRRDVAHEDIGVAAPFVWRDRNVFRMLYSAIGTQWGYYSLAEAVSDDGYTWDRGPGDENLSLAPTPDKPGSWEAQMVEYASVIREGDHLRLFYCGNGYGATGIGTALTALPE